MDKGTEGIVDLDILKPPKKIIKLGGVQIDVSAMLPTGLISNHYKTEDWDLFQIPEVEKALYKFDGHTPQDVLVRLKNLIKI